MPSRYLRAGILDSKRIGRLSEGAVALYYRLLSLIDDYGRYEADPELIIVNAYKWVAGGYTAEMIEQRLQECATAGAITIYEAKGKRLLEVYDPERRPFAKKSRYADPVPVGNRKELTGTDRAGGPSPNTNTETKTNTPSLNSSLKEINTPPVERETPLGPVRIAPKSSRTPSPEEIDVFSDTVEDVVATYPNPRDSGPSRLALVARFSGTEKADDLTLFLTNLALFKQTRSWRDKNGAFVPKLWDFVESGRWKHPPIRDEPTDRTSEKLARLDRVLGGGEKHASQ